MDEQFNTLLDDATAGLKDDPELRLDIRAELASHLQATAAALAEDGHDETESVALAAQAFGSPLEVAGELLAANKRRMTLRALTRLFLRAVVVPAAVLIALLMGYNGVVAFHDTLRLLYGLTERPSIWLPNLPNLPFMSSPLQHFYSTTGQPAFRLEQAYAYWQRHPAKTAYFTAGTIRRMMGSKSVAETARDVSIGARLDPGNGLYQFALADATRGNAAYATTVKHRGAWNPDALSFAEMRLKVYDRARLDLAMREFLTATTYPVITTHQRDRLREQLALLPPGRQAETQLFRMAVMASLLMPEYSRLREFARILPLYAQLLYREGKRTEALRYLATWQSYARQVACGTESLIGVMSANTIAKTVGLGAAAVYDEMGLPAEAARARAAVVAMTAPVEHWIAGAKTSSQDDGFFLVMLPRNSGDLVSAAALRPSRWVEQFMLERGMCSLWLLGLGVLLLITAVSTLDWMLHLRRYRQPLLLLLLDGRAWGRIVGWSLLPPALFLLIFHGSWLFDITWGTTGRYVLLFAGMLTAWAAMYLVAVVLAIREVRRRCRLLGVPEVTEPGHHTEQRRASWRSVSLLVLFSGVVLLVVPIDGDALLLHDPAAICTTLFAVLWLVVLAARLLDRQTDTNRYACYQMAVSHTLLLTTALMMVLTGGIIYPLLLRAEARNIRRDTLVFSQGNDTPIFTPVEARLVERLRGGMLAGFEQ